MNEFLRAADIAPRLGVCPSRVYQLMQAGMLPVVRRGHAVMVPRKAFEMWLEMQNATALASVKEPRDARAN